ncbi:MAG: hypothetical protein JWQ20_2428 [Conexibacter sp.]|nr:hypothetical protein [Conexibacter sp.]
MDGIGRVAESALPDTDVAAGDVLVSFESPELVDVWRRPVDQRQILMGVPGLKDGDPGADVAEAEREVHDVVHDVDGGPAAMDGHRAAAGKGDGLDAIVGSRMHEDGAPLLLEGLLGEAR